MTVGNEVVLWSLGIFMAFILILMLLIKFWVGRFNEFDQNGIFDEDLEDANLNTKPLGIETKKTTLYFQNEKVVSSSKSKMRDFKNQIPL